MKGYLHANIGQTSITDATWAQSLFRLVNPLGGWTSLGQISTMSKKTFCSSSRRSGHGPTIL